MSEQTKKRWNPFRRKDAEQKAPEEKAAREPLKVDSLRRETRTWGDYSVGGSDLICSAVGLISRTVAGCSFHLKRDRVILTDDWREQLINCQPGDNMTPYNFKAMMEVQRNTTGSAYAFLVPDPTDTMVERIDMLDPARVECLRDTETGRHWYRVQLAGEGKVLIMPRERVLCLHFMPLAGGGSVNPLHALSGAMQFGDTVKDITIKQMKGVRDTIVLNVPGGVGLHVQGQKNVVQEFLDVYNATDGGVAVLQGQMSANVLRRDMIDSKLIDLDKVTMGKVSSVYSIPPALMGSTDNASQQGLEAQMQLFMQTAIFGKLQSWVDELNQIFVTRDEYAHGVRWECDATAAFSLMPSTATNYYKNAVRSGWMTPNDIRRREGLPDDPNGDRLLVSRDLIPLDVVVQDPGLLLEGVSKNDEEEADD